MSVSLSEMAEVLASICVLLESTVSDKVAKLVSRLV